jgi:hypothetical protein
MRKKFILPLVSATALFALTFFIFTSALSNAATDVRLADVWGMNGTGVGYSGGEGAVFTLLLGADGRAVIENIEGCMIITEPATWKADGQKLTLTPAKKPKSEDWGGGYSYSVDGKKYKVNNWTDRERIYEYSADENSLTLHPAEGGGAMVLHRGVKGPL